MLMHIDEPADQFFFAMNYVNNWEEDQVKDFSGENEVLMDEVEIRKHILSILPCT